jgi:hypothetical protein
MSKYPDLVQRLRGVNWVCHTYGKTEVLHDTVCHEAADAIEHLMSEIDFLDEHWRKNKKRIAELEAALKPFIVELLPQHNVFGCKQVFVKPQELAAARKVLGEK